VALRTFTKYKHMEGLHIAVVVVPAHGHINPTLATASSLIASHNRVTYAAPARFAPLLRNIGAEVLTYQISAIPEGLSRGASEALFSRRDTVQADILNAVAANKYFLENPPDLILYDHGSLPGAALSAQLPNVPAIKLFPSFAHNGGFPAPGLGCGQDSVGNIRAIIGPTIDIDEEDFIFSSKSACNIVFIPPFFQPKLESFDRRFTFVGPSLCNRDFYGTWTHQHGDRRRIVLISLGTAINVNIEFFQACLAALRDVDLKVIMSVGRGVDLDALKPIPRNFEVYTFVSHIDILPFASAYIGHGGMNSTMEALYYGVPLLIAPQDDYQGLIAVRVEELGLGKVLSQPFTDRTALKEATLALLDDRQVAANVKDASAKLRSSESTSLIMEIIRHRLGGLC
jgi:MGT family glycosyltransferase